MRTQSPTDIASKKGEQLIYNCRKHTAAAVVILVFLHGSMVYSASEDNTSVSMILQERNIAAIKTISSETNGLSNAVANELSRLLSSRYNKSTNTDNAIQQFYKARRYQPLWVGDRGPTIRAKELIDTLKTSGGEGLFPQVYKVSTLEDGLKAIEPSMLAKFDNALTTVFIRYVGDLRHGRVRARDVEPGLFPEPLQLDVTNLLKETVRAKDFSSFLDGLTPSVYGYRKLREVLEHYKTLAMTGGWPSTPEGSALRQGMTDPRVLVLRQRLRVTGELRSEDESSTRQSSVISPIGRNTERIGLVPIKFGNWNAMEKQKLLALGVKYPEFNSANDVTSIHFLSVASELTQANNTSVLNEYEVFDKVVEEAVRRFQQRHGLEPDGVVGNRTLATLNISVEARMRQIVLTMERWRWIPSHLEQPHVIVNIPAAVLEVWENEKLALNMKVIVGHPKHQTPVLKTLMTHLILNPLWNVPHRLAVEDVVKKARKDPAYMSKQRIRVFMTVDNSAVEVDPLNVDWHRVGRKKFPYQLRQDAGPKNAMGRIKFLMPNRESIYLHDTPTRHLFLRAMRAESSGCIRLEKPVELAAYLLSKQTGWNHERMELLTTGTKTETIPLHKPVPIYIVYRTTWVDDDGILQFRSDLYGRDSLLAKALLARLDM